MKEKGCLLNAYVIMPNHMHLILYHASENEYLNSIISESKRFLAYEIVNRLKRLGKKNLIDTLKQGVQENERKKGKVHQVLRLSFDAKMLDEIGIERVLDYIHHNPVKGRWNLVSDYVDFKYSSAGFYEEGRNSLYDIVDFRMISESSNE